MENDSVLKALKPPKADVDTLLEFCNNPVPSVYWLLPLGMFRACWYLNPFCQSWNPWTHWLHVRVSFKPQTCCCVLWKRRTSKVLDHSSQKGPYCCLPSMSTSILLPCKQPQDLLSLRAKKQTVFAQFSFKAKTSDWYLYLGLCTGESSSYPHPHNLALSVLPWRCTFNSAECLWDCTSCFCSTPFHPPAARLMSRPHSTPFAPPRNSTLTLGSCSVLSWPPMWASEMGTLNRSPQMAGLDVCHFGFPGSGL